MLPAVPLPSIYDIPWGYPIIWKTEIKSIIIISASVCKPVVYVQYEEAFYWVCEIFLERVQPTGRKQCHFRTTKQSPSQVVIARRE